MRRPERRQRIRLVALLSHVALTTLPMNTDSSLAASCGALSAADGSDWQPRCLMWRPPRRRRTRMAAALPRSASSAHLKNILAGALLPSTPAARVAEKSGRYAASLNAFGACDA